MLLVIATLLLILYSVVEITKLNKLGFKNGNEIIKKINTTLLIIGIVLPVVFLLIQLILFEDFSDDFFAFAFYEVSRIVTTVLAVVITCGCVVLYFKDFILRNKMLELLGSIVVLICIIIFGIIVFTGDAIHQTSDNLNFLFVFLHQIKYTFFVIYTFGFSIVEVYIAFHK